MLKSFLSESIAIQFQPQADRPLAEVRALYLEKSAQFQPQADRPLAEVRALH